MAQQQTGTASHRTNKIHQEDEKQRQQLRLFFAWLYAIALLGSIVASVIIVIITKNPLPAVVPSALLLAMRPIIHWVYSDGNRNDTEQPDQIVPFEIAAKQIEHATDKQQERKRAEQGTKEGSAD